MAFVTADKDSAEMDIITSKSIDDEHTPGVFEVSFDTSRSQNVNCCSNGVGVFAGI